MGRQDESRCPIVRATPRPFFQLVLLKETIMAVSTVNSAAPTAAPVVDTTGSQAAGVAADPAAQQTGGMTAADLAALQNQISQSNRDMYAQNLASQQSQMVDATAYNAMASLISNTGKVMAKTISETNKMIDKATG
jgi:hypothetical protein